MRIEEIKTLLAKHKQRLREKYKVKEIAIFGSYVRGEQKEISDVDIYLEFEEPIGWEFVDLCEELEAILGRKVDVVTKDGVIRKPSLWNAIKEELVYV